LTGSRTAGVFLIILYCTLRQQLPVKDFFEKYQDFFLVRTQRLLPVKQRKTSGNPGFPYNGNCVGVMLPGFPDRLLKSGTGKKIKKALDR
jgi:hypothetical protein